MGKQEQSFTYEIQYVVMQVYMKIVYVTIYNIKYLFFK